MHVNMTNQKQTQFISQGFRYCRFQGLIWENLYKETLSLPECQIETPANFRNPTNWGQSAIHFHAPNIISQILSENPDFYFLCARPFIDINLQSIAFQN